MSSDSLPRDDTDHEGAKPVLSIDELKRRKAQDRETRIAQIEAERAEKMRQRVAEMERLDEDDDILAETPAAAARGTEEEPGPMPVASPVNPTRLRTRHVLTALSFVVMVMLPVAVSAWYLWARAADRYLSEAGFSVRTEEVSSAIELLGGVAALSGSSSSDTDILYQFIQSQELVRSIDSSLDLRGMWSRADPAIDPFFAYHAPGTIEDLTEYWERMVKVFSDSGTGLINLEVQAFAPEDAHEIAQMIYAKSSYMINELSAIAREDSTRYAREELDTAVERLKTAREALTRFRNETQIVDPAASIQSQMGLLSSLQMQLAQTLIDLDILRQTTSESDPRIVVAERRIEVIQQRMEEERNKLGFGAATPDGTNPGAGAFADLVGDYERLSVDQQFAEQSYTAALAAYDAAIAESRRQSRYLAAHVRPTLAESPQRPQRVQLLSMVALFAFLIWAIATLTAYAVKDRH